MASEDVRHRIGHACVEVVEGLRSGPTLPVLVERTLHAIDEVAVDLGLGETIDRDTHFGESFDRDRGEARHLCERGGGFL